MDRPAAADVVVRAVADPVGSAEGNIAEVDAGVGGIAHKGAAQHLAHDIRRIGQVSARSVFARKLHIAESVPAVTVERQPGGVAGHLRIHIHKGRFILFLVRLALVPAAVFAEARSARHGRGERRNGFFRLFGSVGCIGCILRHAGGGFCLLRRDFFLTEDRLFRRRRGVLVRIGLILRHAGGGFCLLRRDFLLTEDRLFRRRRGVLVRFRGKRVHRQQAEQQTYCRQQSHPFRLSHSSLPIFHSGFIP